MLLLLAGVCGLVVCAALSLALGARAVSLPSVLDALFGIGHGPDAAVVTGLRLPRTAVGLVVGAALGVAGAVAQGITRNPLASPTTLGVNAGAGLAVVTAIYVLHLTRPVEYVWFACAGAALAALAALSMGRGSWGGRSDLDPVRLALGGTVLAAVLTSWTSAVMLLDQRTLDEARFWLAGSIEGRGFDVLLPMLPFIGTGLVLAFAVSPALNALALGDETAQALGVPVARVRTAGAVAVVLLAAGAVAVAGPVSFVGLAAPHLVRLGLGADHRRLVPGCLVAGPLLLLGADVLGRVVIRPSELEVGIVTAFLGSPLLALLARKAAR
ncbi:iron ABC transporter permease [Streptomyces sp. RB6PN25]|uniref:Iron ABC transporter permease n=1 Tax=Streptomyces humicola TaxID=2953240 RepID=A0ABT1PXD8_9ACTN|nr:iron ABC transporter permease [Streptomyces humicola]MCQ4082334.1 iron ABC transporter permease [Streptomyces humicola]